MPYTVPAPADLVARFPAFAAVDPNVIGGALTEAQTRVDTSWLPEDFSIALVLYAAHVMTLDGLGTGADAAMAAAGALGFQTMRAGSLDLERRPVPGRPQDNSLLGETTYGRRFLALLKVNQPAVAVP